MTLGSADGGTVRPLVGLNAGPIHIGDATNPDLSSQYRSLGVNFVRTHDFSGPFDLAAIYGDGSKDPSLPSSYNFTLSDSRYQSILDCGAEVYLRLGNSSVNSMAIANEANVVKAFVEIVRHFRDTRWSKPVRYVEIWNEPNQHVFWSDTPEAFIQLYVDTYKALRAAFPDLKIGGPGFADNGYSSSTGQAFVTQFLDRLQAEHLNPDFLSFHVYGTSASLYTQAANFYRSALNSHGMSTTELHITEWNASNTEANADATYRTGGKGAALLSACWVALQNADVRLSTYYKGPDPSMSLPSFYGIYYANGTPKVPALAFALWQKLSTHTTRLACSAASGTGLTVFAGKDSSGECAVLIVNPTATATTWTLSRSGSGTLYEASDSSPSAVTSRSVGSLSASIGAYTVQLVTFR